MTRRLFVERALRRGLTAQRAARTHSGVADPPALDAAPGIVQAAKPMDIQALIAKLPAEALQISVLHRLTRMDEAECNVACVGPGVERLAGELGAVIQRDALGAAGRAILDDKSR